MQVTCAPTSASTRPQTAAAEPPPIWTTLKPASKVMLSSLLARLRQGYARALLFSGKSLARQPSARRHGGNDDGSSVDDDRSRDRACRRFAGRWNGACPEVRRHLAPHAY